MAAQLLVISRIPQDLEFATQIAALAEMGCTPMKDVNELRRSLVSHKECVVLMNCDDIKAFEESKAVLPKYVPAHKVIAVTEKPIRDCPHLHGYPIFGHHLLRRYNPPAPQICAQLVKGIFRKETFGIERFFPPEVSVKKIMIEKIAHKRAAVEAVQLLLSKHNVKDRLAALVAQTMDELIINAIFDAPMVDKVHLRHNLPRDADYHLVPQEKVEVKFAMSPYCIGISVTDQFGSLQKKVLLDSLLKTYDDQGSKALMGLHASLEAGINLLFTIKPGVKTEATLLFPKVENYKEFRAGLRWLSVIVT